MDEVWLLELEIAGRRWLFATEEVDVLDAAGETWRFAEGLRDPEASQASVVGADAAVGLELETDIDWARLVAAGHALDGCPGVLRRWAPGTALERAVIVLRGRTAAPSWGEVGEPLTLRLERTVRGTSRVLPPPQAVVDAATWGADDLPEAYIGSVYPVVIGAPGHTDDPVPVPCVPVPQVEWRDPLQSHTETTTGSYDSHLAPALIELDYRPRSLRVFRTPSGGDEYELFRGLDYYTMWDAETEVATLVVSTAVDLDTADTLRIEYDHLERASYPGTRSRLAWIGGHATQVRLLVGERAPAAYGVRPGAGSSGAPVDDVSVSRGTDSLGNRVDVVLRSYPLAGGNGEGYGSPDDTFLVGFRDDAIYGGGLVTRRGELLRGAGDVIEWVLLEQYTGVVDHGRLAVRQFLNRWKIDTWIDARVAALDWLVREILPLVPVELREGAHGLYPAVLRQDLEARDAVAVLDATQNCSRESPVTLTDDEPANEITVDYRPSGGRWLSRVVLTSRAGALAPEPRVDPLREPGAEDTRVVASTLCAASQQRYGVRPLAVETKAVWDTTTALLVAQHLARRAWPRRRVRYRVGPEFAHLQVGDAVLITDQAVHVEDQVAAVADVLPVAGGADLDLVLLDRP